MQIETEYQHRFPGLGEVVLSFFEQAVTADWRVLEARLIELAQGLPGEWAKDGVAILDALYRTGVVGIESPGGNLWFANSREFEELAPVISGGRFSVVVHPAFHRWLRCWGSAVKF